MPNGRSLDDDHYTYELSWLDRLVEHLKRDTSPGADVIVTGDLDVTLNHDVYDMRKFQNATHVTSAEHDRLAALEALGPDRSVPTTASAAYHHGLIAGETSIRGGGSDRSRTRVCVDRRAVSVEHRRSQRTQVAVITPG